MSGWVVAAFTLVALCLTETPSWSAPLQVEVDITDCPDLVESDARKLLGIELLAAQISASPSTSTLQVSATCDESHVDLVVHNATVGTLSRDLHWQAVESSARTRLFALAVAEMVTAAYREQQVHLGGEHREDTKPKAAPVLLARAPMPPAPNITASTLHVRTGVTRVGSSWSWAPTLMAGMSRPWRRSPHVFFSANVSGMHANADLPGGSVALTSLGITPSVGLQTSGAKFVGYFETGVMLALASADGRATDDRVQGNRRTAFWWGPMATVGVSRVWPNWQIGLTAATMLAANTIKGRSLSGTTLRQSADVSELVPSVLLSVARRF